MANRIIKKMNDLKIKGGKGFSVVLMIGDESPEDTTNNVQIALECGVDIIELGIPYAHPYLDSGIMKASMNRALKWSTDLHAYLDYLKQIRSLYPQVPFEVMIYHDTVMQIGLENFAHSLNEAQMDAVLVADYVKKGREFLSDLDRSLATTEVLPIRFVPHKFDPQQVEDIARNGRGFVISQTVTDESGERKSVLDENKEKADFLRSHGVNTPLVFAYGIKTPADVQKCVELGADGTLLGTIILDAAHRMEKEDFRSFLRSLRQAAI